MKKLLSMFMGRVRDMGIKIRKVGSKSGLDSIAQNLSIALLGAITKLKCTSNSVSYFLFQIKYTKLRQEFKLSTKLSTHSAS